MTREIVSASLSVASLFLTIAVGLYGHFHARKIYRESAAMRADALRTLQAAVRVTNQSQPCIVCPRCRRVSYNPNDIREQYCGNCHEAHATMPEAHAHRT